MSLCDDVESDAWRMVNDRLAINESGDHSEALTLTPQVPGPTVIQLHLPGLEDVPLPRRRRMSRARRQTEQLSLDPLVDTYLLRLRSRGAAVKGLQAYRYQLRAVARLAQSAAGHPVTMGELFCDPSLLGRVLVDDMAPNHGSQLSKWTLAQRRSAIRSFVTLMRPELFDIASADPHLLLNQALQSVAVRIGAGYRLTGGTPRQRGGYAPRRDEVQAVLKAVSTAEGFLGPRNLAFYGILAATGSRVNSLRALDSGSCVQLLNGCIRLFLHEKGKHEPREVELGRELSSALLTYRDMFNECAAQAGWRVRIQLGESGLVWRQPGGKGWRYHEILRTLRAGCATAEVLEFSPHSLRRAFASDAATLLPRHTVAQAGGWKGLERLDDHYIQPREGTIWSKLGCIAAQRTTPEIVKVKTDAPSVPV